MGALDPRPRRGRRTRRARSTSRSTVGGAADRAPATSVVLDADGAAVVAAERVEEVLEAALEREERERVKREKLRAGALSYDLDHLRERVE